jgi:tRNA nucleotidyltransferase (CCA-adding enzyme)
MKKLDFLGKIIDDITPSDAEKVHEGKIIAEIINALKRSVDNNITPTLVGSLAKGTDLRNNKDIDVFLVFEKKVPRKELEKKGLDIGRGFFKANKAPYETSYAEHPYTRGLYKGFRLEIVPCYKIKKGEKIVSAVDRSPLHTDYVMKKITDKERVSIRLLKRFMTARGLYGANAAVEGFSGYLCELLVIKYGSFEAVLKAASEWREGEFITLTRGSKKGFDAPLIFIDPVDGKRNVAAAVSLDKLAGFVVAAKAFLRDPSTSFFHEKRFDALEKKDFERRLRKRQSELICVSFELPKLIEETLIPQLNKSLSALVKEVEHHGFRVMKSAQWSDGKQAVLMLELDVWSLPAVEKRKGPGFDASDVNVAGFLKKNKKDAISKPYMEGGFWMVDAKRDKRDAKGFVKGFVKEPLGFGKDIRLLKKVNVYSNWACRKIESPGFWEFMAKKY